MTCEGYRFVVTSSDFGRAGSAHFSRYRPIVHLAGALNKPVWVLLPSGSEWRWLRNRKDSPWYPSRPTASRAWDAIMTEVVQALQQRVMDESFLHEATQHPEALTYEHH